MTLRNTPRRWGAIAQLLHWLIVLFIVAQFTLATLFEQLPAGAKKLTLLSRHKSIGITILTLAVVRLAWRWSNPTPTLPDTLKPYERTSRGSRTPCCTCCCSRSRFRGGSCPRPVGSRSAGLLPASGPRPQEQGPCNEALLTTHGILA
jgi:hypothetical protein